MTRPIFLIGYRGVGKSAIARALSARLGVPWVDADALLEQRAGKSIRDIFATEGEASFRELEAATLRELADFDGVVATGGGVVLRPENRAILKRGQVIWLTAPAAVIWRRMQADTTTSARRPNLAQGGLAEIETLLAQREPLYRECAAAIVDSTVDGPDHIAATIVESMSLNPVHGVT
ncbi:MAG: shikimate kinase [Planctomycetota bacterium]